MTAEAAVLNKSGVALAADSKATLRIKGTPKSHDAANKLFTLSKYHPVGIMINGNAEFMGTPWETIIKLYRDRLREKCLPVLEQYAEDFLLSLTCDFVHKDDTQNENVFFILVDLFGMMASRASELQERDKTLDEARDTAIDGQRRTHLAAQDLPSLNGVTPNDIGTLYNTQIQRAIDLIFEKVTDSQKEKLFDYARNVLLKGVFSNAHSEVVIAGFGDDEIYPSLQSWMVDGVIAGRLRCQVAKGEKISLENGSSIIPIAQREMVDRFMVGIDPEYGRYLERTFSQMLQSTSRELITTYGKGTEAEKAKILEETDLLVRKKLQEHLTTIDEYRFSRFAQPIIDMTEQLPKDELAHLAESLVNLTSFKRRVSLDAESVGGAIDVAVISKGDGFVWIKRKHYFDADINRTFIENYFRRHVKAIGETANDRRKKQK